MYLGIQGSNCAYVLDKDTSTGVVVLEAASR